ncbi:MAG: hypothetical protein HC781_06405 [Leptolyngbyaceae cyanobacterium CSU_1_4]|nr:hypothetical protein [Leptolyngbyaceae cyanobacterium CSU_1_4]
MPQYKLLLPPFQTPEATFSQEGEVLELSEADASAAIASGVLEPIAEEEKPAAKAKEEKPAAKAKDKPDAKSDAATT